MATLSPVSTFLANFTLAKLPSPTVLPSSYFPTRVLVAGVFLELIFISPHRPIKQTIQRCVVYLCFSCVRFSQRKTNSKFENSDGLTHSGSLTSYEIGFSPLLLLLFAKNTITMKKINASITESSYHYS